jgi:hypothetical protein
MEKTLWRGRVGDSVNGRKRVDGYNGSGANEKSGERGRLRV